MALTLPSQKKMLAHSVRWGCVPGGLQGSYLGNFSIIMRETVVWGLHAVVSWKSPLWVPRDERGNLWV